jgi:16S rRNA (guanine527-N7)-methyltransferase
VFHVKHEGWTDLPRIGLDLDSIQLERLELYERLLVGSAVPMGMVARSDTPRLRERHLLDCLRAVPFIQDDDETACDMGSGAGLPGIPVAIARRDLSVTLVEVRRNRAAFLERVVSELDLVNVRVHARRLETFRTPSDVCFARAFASARASWEAASRIVSEDGRLIYWAGERYVPAADAPEGVRVELFPNSALARSGPLAIMSAQ